MRLAHSALRRTGLHAGLRGDNAGPAMLAFVRLKALRDEHHRRLDDVHARLKEVPLRAVDAWVIAGVGVTGFLGQVAITEAFRSGEASVVAPFEYSALAWGLGLDLMIWGVLPDGWTFFGAGIIVASGLYMVHRERVLGRRRAA